MTYLRITSPEITINKQITTAVATEKLKQNSPTFPLPFMKIP